MTLPVFCCSNVELEALWEWSRETLHKLSLPEPSERPMHPILCAFIDTARAQSIETQTTLAEAPYYVMVRGHLRDHPAEVREWTECCFAPRFDTGKLEGWVEMTIPSAWLPRIDGTYEIRYQLPFRPFCGAMKADLDRTGESACNSHLKKFMVTLLMKKSWYEDAVRAGMAE